MIADEILSGLIYAGWRTRILRDPCLLSRYRFGGPQLRPCEAVDISPQGVLHMIRGPRPLNRSSFASPLEQGISIDNEGWVSVDLWVRESVDVKAAAPIDVEH